MCRKTNVARFTGGGRSCALTSSAAGLVNGSSRRLPLPCYHHTIIPPGGSDDFGCKIGWWCGASARTALLRRGLALCRKPIANSVVFSARRSVVLAAPGTGWIGRFWMQDWLVVRRKRTHSPAPQGAGAMRGTHRQQRCFFQQGALFCCRQRGQKLCFTPEGKPESFCSATVRSSNIHIRHCG